MAMKTWTGLAGDGTAAWNTSADWTGGVLPAAGDTVLINQALSGPYTVTLTTNEGSLAALTVAANNAKLALSGANLTLSVAGLTTLSAGTIDISNSSTLSTGSFSETGGAF